jgi:non-heme chloroperoxidase
VNRRGMFQVTAAGLLGAQLGLTADGATSRRNGKPTSPAPPSFPYIRSGDRVSLFYQDWGAGDQVVVFVHGWPLHSDMWQYQMLFLAGAGVRVIAYDQRGCGRSPDPGTGYDFDTLADDLASVMEQLGLHKAILVGHSIGAGQIVRYLSRHGSDRVAGIVLLSASLPYIQRAPDNPDGIDPEHLEHLRLLIRTDTPKWLSHAAKPFVTPETSLEMVEWAVRMCAENSIWTLTNTNHTDVETDFRQELPKINIRTLVVHGDADHSCPLETTGKRVTQLIPGAQLKVYEGAPHGLFLTHMERFNGDLLTFVQS